MAASEFDLIYRYLASMGAGEGVRLGVGDDAAVLSIPPGAELVVSTDTQLVDRHFLADTLPEQIAYRAVAAAASDLAAMAATPLAMTLALTLPDSDELWLHSFSMGLAQAVASLGLPLVGGDLTRGPLAITVTVMGHAPLGRWVTRSGAKIGDRLCVTGTLGDAAAGLALLQGALPISVGPAAVQDDTAGLSLNFSQTNTVIEGASSSTLTEEDIEYLEGRFYYPSVRCEWADWMRDHAHAAIDISDGVLADTQHLAAASGLECVIDAQNLPLSQALQRLPKIKALPWALTGGDDYELLLAVPPEVTLPPGLTEIGVFGEGQGVRCNGFEGQSLGFDHFSH